MSGTTIIVQNFMSLIFNFGSLAFPGIMFERASMQADRHGWMG